MSLLDLLRPTSSMRRDREGEPYDRQVSWRFPLPSPLDCEILGHRPVHVPLANRLGGYIECDRCRRRPSRPAVVPVGHKKGMPYLAAFMTLEEYDRCVATEGDIVWSTRKAAVRLEISRGYIDNLSAGFSVGTPGSETPIDAKLIIPGVVGLYLGLEGFGARLVARRRDDETRATSFRIDRQSLAWQIWNPRDSHKAGTPKWQYNFIGWRRLLFGADKSEMFEIDEAEAKVTLPEGEYPVRVKLRRYLTTWDRLRPSSTWYRADVELLDDRSGIPDGGGSGYQSMAFRLPGLVDRDTWVATGIARFTASVLEQRAKHTGDALWTPPADQEARA